jgi:lysophospholipase L1-like esterase
MKTIVCYGDSNTWGFNPVTQDRFSIAERWTGVLAQELGAGYRVIEEGLNGRTTVWDDPVEEWRNGRTYLLPCLWSHKPIDLVTLMLGTNDLKERFSVSAYDIAAGAGVIVDLTLRSGAGPNGGAPKVLLMAPPVVARLTDYAEMFQEAEAKKYGCHFLDTSQVIVSSDLDGIHFEVGEHRQLGLAVAARVREMLG